MPDAHQSDADVKAQRRAALELVGAYHREQLGVLLAHVREGFAQLEAGKIDEFELDQVIHRYKKATTRLWTYCSVSSSAALATAHAIEQMREAGEERDWWSEAESRRERGH
ncbi:MAG: hypothetical protein Q8K63_03605 [Acidimicrobiales bacterium]|nr:hypothetical protein [Acidimicrobiales bacterium]